MTEITGGRPSPCRTAFTSYSYDNASELAGIGYVNGSTNLGSLTYGYDLAGQADDATVTLPNGTVTTVVTGDSVPEGRKHPPK